MPGEIDKASDVKLPRDYYHFIKYAIHEKDANKNSIEPISDQNFTETRSSDQNKAILCRVQSKLSLFPDETVSLHT